MSGLFTTIPAMLEMITPLEHAGERDQVKIMVGSAPVTKAFKRRSVLTVTPVDAASAVRVAKELHGQ